MKFTKEMIGKTIFGLPTGNNARRGVSLKEQPLSVFEVVKIGRVYAELRPKDWKRTDKYDMKSGATEGCVRGGFGGNSGYVFFASLEEYEAYLERSIKKDDIATFCRNYGWGGPRLTEEQTDELHQFLERNNLITTRNPTD